MAIRYVFAPDRLVDKTLMTADHGDVDAISLIANEMAEKGSFVKRSTDYTKWEGLCLPALKGEGTDEGRRVGGCR